MGAHDDLERAPDGATPRLAKPGQQKGRHARIRAHGRTATPEGLGALLQSEIDKWVQ